MEMIEIYLQEKMMIMLKHSVIIIMFTETKLTVFTILDIVRVTTVH